MITINLNGHAHEVPEGTTIAQLKKMYPDEFDEEEEYEEETETKLISIKIKCPIKLKTIDVPISKLSIEGHHYYGEQYTEGTFATVEITKCPLCNKVHPVRF